MARNLSKIEGVKEVQRMLKRSPEHAYAVSKTATSRGITVMRKRMRENAKELGDTGTYSRSIRSAIRASAKFKKNGVVYALTGPDKDYFEHHTDLTSDAERSDISKDGGLRRPMKYAHLVEWGTRHSKAQHLQLRTFTEVSGRVMSRFVKEVPKALIKRMAKDGRRKR